MINGKCEDTLALFDYGIDNFAFKTIVEKGDVLETIKIKNAKSKSNNLDLIVENKISVLVSNSLDINSINPEINLKDNLSAPIKENSILGTITYNIDGIKYTQNILAGNSVKSSLNLFKIILIIFSLIIIYKIFFRKKKKKTKKKILKRKGKDYIGKIRY